MCVVLLVDRLQKTATDIVTENQQTVHSEVLTDIGITVKDSSGHSDTESTEGTLSGTDRQWNNCGRQQWA